jgi:hypothetical protein
VNVTRISLATVAALLAIAYGTVNVQAAQVRGDRAPLQTKGSLSIGGGVKDTCTETNPDDQEQCDPDQLASRCDDAGGGMSSEPGGGVDCDLGPE